MNSRSRATMVHLTYVSGVGNQALSDALAWRDRPRSPAFIWRTADDHPRRFRGHRPAVPRMAQPAMALPADAPVDRVDLPAAGHPEQRFSNHGSPVDGSCADRARLVAWTRTRGPDAGPTPRDLACGH